MTNITYYISSIETLKTGIKNTCSKRSLFLGKIFGKMALKRMVLSDKPFDQGVPTSGQFKIKETSGDIAEKKKEWIQLIESYEHYSNPVFIHDFFGKMTPEEIGFMAYKHTDHHLRQFNS
jgi:hypothetical protein